jgi:hypothetical protein
MVVMATNSSRQARALAQARERRRLLDQARDEQDARVEQATAAALLALDVRSAAERHLAAATAELAAAVRALFGEGVGVDRVAALLEVEVADIRRLAKLTASPAASPAAAAAADSAASLLASAGGDFVAVPRAS